MELPKNVFYSMLLDEEQIAFVEAIKDLRKTIVFCDAPAGTAAEQKGEQIKW